MAAPNTHAPSSSSSSANTAKEIASHLKDLRRSQKRRRKRRHAGAGGGSANADADAAADRDDARRLDALRKVYARLIAAGEFVLGGGGNNNNGNSSGGDDGDASQKWQQWLTVQHDAFVAHLAEGVADGRTTALRTFCGVLASSPVPMPGVESKVGKKREMLSERLAHKLFEAVFRSRACLEAMDGKGKASGNKGSGKDDNGEGSDEQLTADEATLAMLESEFVRPHRDVQYFAYQGIKQNAQELLAGLDRVRTRAAKKGQGENDDDDDGDEANGEGGEEAIVMAETNVGLVAENMCRLLLLMDYVPGKGSDDLDDAAGFLFSPPALSEGDAVADEDNDGSDEEEDVEEDSEEDSSDEDESSDDESAKGRKRRRSQAAANEGRNHKRAKIPTLVPWQRTYKHRHAHQEAWLAVLRLPNLPSRTQKQVLQHLSGYVLTVCPSPLRFAEYFSRSFQLGTGKAAAGVMAGSSSAGTSSLASILSLQGLFVLMLEHRLEYPQFYNSLYRLLHPRILYTKHRAQFLRLLSKSLLSNSMLPAYVAAAFSKRLCRLALAGPPSGALFALALVSNLLRKHGECACLVHRRGKVDDGGCVEDVFVEDVEDLADSRALESSLWELAALEKHYHPAVAAMAGAVGTEDDRTTPMHAMEDFVAHTYKSLFETEKKRLGSGGGGGGKKKGRGGKVSLTFVEPEGLFAKDDVFGTSFKCS